MRRILGIHPGNTFKSSLEKNIRICNGVKLEKLFHIRKYINESRFYTSDELMKIIDLFKGITLSDIIIYFINARRYYNSKDYELAFIENNGLYIGKCKMPDNYFKENIESINNFAHELSRKLKKGYFDLDYDDISQEIILYIYENCGDLLYNFGNSQKFIEKLISRTAKAIIGYEKQKYFRSCRRFSLSYDNYDSSIRSIETDIETKTFINLKKIYMI